MATVTSLYVRILGDASGLQSTLAKSSAAIKGFSTGAQASTGAVTKSAVGMTAAFIGIAAAAKAAADFTAFEATMTRTVTLAGATEEQMRSASAEILNVAASLGKGPQELAEALYFTESAGIDAADAMDVVTVAAKASAVGLGETQVVADALTSVINAYGAENITAARAADILTAAVREGKGEADAIAGAIGRVIPIASEMGVQFEEVAAGIAAMTRTGLDAEEAATALRGALTAMLNPSVQARDLLEGVGVSADALRASIREQGLLDTLTDLQHRFEGNDEAFGTLFGNVRAQTGVLSLLGSNAGEVAEVFRDVAASGGTVEEAFARVQETAEFKLKQALAAVEVALIEVGGALAPLVTSLAGVVGSFADIVGNAGPLTFVLETLAENLDLIAKAFAAWFLAAKVIPGLLGLLADAALTTAIRVQGMGAAGLTAASGLEKAKLAVAGLSTVISVGLAAALVGLPELLDAASVKAKTLADSTGFATEQVQRFLDLADANAPSGLIQSIFSPEANLQIASLDGLNDNMRDLLTASVPAFQALQKFGLAAGTSGDYIVRLGEGLTDFSKAGQEDFVATLNTNIATIQRQSAALKAGATPISSFIERMTQIGFTTEEAFVLAHLATGKAIDGLKELEGETIKATDITTAYGRGHAEVANIVERGANRMTEAQRQQAEAARIAAQEQVKFNRLMEQAGPVLDNFASAIGSSTDEILTGLHAAAKQGPEFVKAFVTETLAGLAEWRTEAAASLTGIDGVLSDLADDAHLTAAEVHEAFTQAAQDTRAFTADLVEIAKSGGQAGKDLANALLEMGPSAAGLADVVAGAGGKMRDQLIADFGAITGAGQDGARKLQGALVGPLNDIRDILLAIAKHWGVDVELNDHGSNSKLSALESRIKALTGHTYTINVAVQGSGGIPPVLQDLIAHQGGYIMHEGGALKADEVPAVLQRGEFVLRRSAVQKIGVPALSAMNRMHEGGFAGQQPSETGSISILAAVLERAVTNAIGNASNQNGNGGGDGGILALLRHNADIASLFTLMGTTVHRFATEAQKALKPDQWQEFSRAMNDALRSDDWRAFADQIREAVGPKVWKKMVDDARKAFESGNLKFISATIKDALQVEEWQAFARTVRQDATAALQSFHDAAVSALSFADTALSELTSAASQAAAELKGGTDITGQALFRLRQDATLTGFDILKAFQRSAKETRAFGRDLLEISKIGGQAGKDLAASLLASGDILAAQTIANAPRQLQVDIAHAFSEAGKAADQFANKLTASIAGTLKDIEKILKAIAKDWDINLNLNAERRHSGGLLASDEVPAILQKGEYVIRKSAVNRVGVDTLSAINRLHEGGSADGLRMLRDLAPMQPAPAAAKVNVTVALPKPADVNLRVSPDRRQFGRSMDYADMTDGRW